MSYLKFLENKQHATGNFPLAYYLVDEKHSHYRMPQHWHKETEILYVRQGQLTITIDGAILEVNEGCLCYIPSGSIHSGEPINCTYECIDFDLNAPQLQIPAIKDALSAIKEKNCEVFYLFTRKHPAVLQGAQRLFESVNLNSDGQVLYIISSLIELYGAIMQHHYYEAPPVATVRAQKVLLLKGVLEFLDKNYNQPISLEQLSRMVGMCPKYFCRVFREVIHRTPIDYVISLRVEKACEILTEDEISITEVAYRCGFNDSCYFARCFKRYTGISPKQYFLSKKKVLGNELFE